MMRIGLDTNIVAYAAGLKNASADVEKVRKSRALLETLGDVHDMVLAAQVLGELFNVIVRNGMRRSEARNIVAVFAAKYRIATSNRRDFDDALTLAVDHRLQIWDALILTTSAAAGCSVLVSEDMQDGFTIRGITVVNPFATPVQPVFAKLLAG